MKTEEEIENLLKYQLPLSFGQQKEEGKKWNNSIYQTKRNSKDLKINENIEKNEILIGPPKPPIKDYEENEEYETEDVNGSIEESELNESNFYKIPYSHEIQLCGHKKMVSCLALDPAGGRLLTGSYDYNVLFWDFVGMDSSLKSFRSIEPAEGNQIKSLDYSITGDKFLVATGSPQAKLYDRDGIEIGECIRGDMYLTDMSNTKGHVSELGKAVWNPVTKDLFITCSVDGTIREWDCEQLTKQKNILKHKGLNNKKIGVTTCTYSLDAKYIIGGCQDGSIQIWAANGPFIRPQSLLRNAHQEGNDITCITFSKDNNTFVSRSLDNSMKIWDIRNFKKPLISWDDLPNYGDTDVIFSPDEKLIITGTGVKKGQGTGLLVFYDKTLLTKVNQIGVSPGSSVISMLWHPKINQIIVGTSNGKVHVFFDPFLSKNGALLCVTKAPRQKDPNDYEPPRPIYAPNALPMFMETPNSKRKKLRNLYNPKKSIKVIPSSVPGKGGKIGASVTQHLIKNYITKDNTREEDPREAILKYAKEAEEKPYFMAVYKKTQPITPFDYSEEKDDLNSEKKD